MSNFFTDTISRDLTLNSTNRVDSLDLLEPETRKRVLAIIEDAQALGFTLRAFETYRSQERQQQLFDQHATQLRQVGVHHYGLACDLVKVVGGQPSWKGDFSFLGQLAREHALIWGGDWGTPNLRHTFVDTVHVQRCTMGKQPALFRGEWYPDANYDPYKD